MDGMGAKSPAPDFEVGSFKEYVLWKMQLVMPSSTGCRWSNAIPFLNPATPTWIFKD
jgi:hypothetical protein